MIKKTLALFVINIFIFSLNSMPMESEVIPIPDEPSAQMDVPAPEIDIVTEVVSAPIQAAPIEMPTSSVGLPAVPEEVEIDKQQQALEQLKIDVDSIEQDEEILMTKLNELQNQINQAQTQESSARQTKAEILNAQTIDQAKQLLDQLNMIADQIQGIETRLQGPFSQEFNNVATTIHNKIQNVTAKINEIKNINAAIVSQPEIQEMQLPMVVKEKVKLKSTFAQRAADAIAFIIDSFLDIIDWIKNWISKIMNNDDVAADKVDQVEDETVQLTPIAQTDSTVDNLSKKLDDQMISYERKIGQLSERKKKIKQEEMQIEEKKKLLAELKMQKTALKKYQNLMKQLGLTMETAKKEQGEIKSKLLFAFGKVLDFGGYVLEKIGIVSSGIYNRIFLPRLEKFVVAVQQRVEQDEAKEIEPSPPEPFDMTIQSTGMEPIASIPPQPMPQMPIEPQPSPSPMPVVEPMPMPPMPEVPPVMPGEPQPMANG